VKYLLDTSICVFFFRDRFNIADALRAKGPENCCVSEITVAELRYGAENIINPQKHHQLLDAFLQQIATIPITNSIRTYAEEKVRLKKAGTPLHDEFDLLIGASAIYNGLTLVTDNLKDFKHMAGIQIENWTKRPEK
jgi:tRNA(fMet)-specific endonuclease VapC